MAVRFISLQNRVIRLGAITDITFHPPEPCVTIHLGNRNIKFSGDVAIHTKEFVDLLKTQPLADFPYIVDLDKPSWRKTKKLYTPPPKIALVPVPQLFSGFSEAAPR